MPRFQAHLPATSLRAQLEALGLEHLFDESAHLEGITSAPDAKLHVADVPELTQRSRNAHATLM